MRRVKDGQPGARVFKEDVMDVVQEKGFRTFGDYLYFYNSVDVECMMPVNDKMTNNFKGVEPMIEIGVENVSLHHTARILPHKSVAKEHGAEFFLPQGEVLGELLERSIRRCLFGGPSIIFHRECEAYETRTPGGHLVQQITTEDANGLYAHSMERPLPAGRTIHYYGPDDFDVTKEEEEEEKPWIYKEIGKRTRRSSCPPSKNWDSHQCNDKCHQGSVQQVESVRRG